MSEVSRVKGTESWLVHLYPPITRKRRCAIFWTNPHSLRSWPFSKISCWRFDFFPRKFAACSKPPSRDNYRKASYSRTQQRDQGAGWTHDPAIRVVVKTTPLPIRPRYLRERTALVIEPNSHRTRPNKIKKFGAVVCTDTDENKNSCGWINIKTLLHL